MLPTQRRQAILAEVRQTKAVSAEELARRFGVSLETIRRDLRGLRDRGLLERVYGGALSVRSTEGDFATRSALHAPRKLAIAQLAATLVEPEDTIVIDIGTTALEVARALPESFRGRVLTNSVPAAMALADREEIDLLLCGGQVRHGDAACYGAQAEAFFADFYADKAFLGSGGVHAQAGLTDYHPPEVATRRTIIAHAAASYVLADSSKLGAIAVHRVCPLSRVTAVLTDPEASPEATEALAGAGCTRAIWTWPIVIVGQSLVALVYGALSVRVPLSGYSYQWASRLANVSVGWWFGWMSFAFLTIVTVSVDYGLVQVAFQPLIGETYTPTSAALETLVVLALQAALIIASTRVTTRVNNAAVATEIIGIAGLTVLLLIVAAVRSMGHSPPGYLVAVALRGGGRPEIGGGRGRWPARTGAALTSSPRRARPRWSGPWRTCGGSRARGRPVSAGSGWTRHDSRTPGRSRGRASRPAAGQAAALVPAGAPDLAGHGGGDGLGVLLLVLPEPHLGPALSRGPSRGEGGRDRGRDRRALRRHGRGGHRRRPSRRACPRPVPAGGRLAGDTAAGGLGGRRHRGGRGRADTVPPPGEVDDARSRAGVGSLPALVHRGAGAAGGGVVVLEPGGHDYGRTARAPAGGTRRPDHAERGSHDRGHRHTVARDDLGRTDQAQCLADDWRQRAVFLRRLSLRARSAVVGVAPGPATAGRRRGKAGGIARTPPVRLE